MAHPLAVEQLEGRCLLSTLQAISVPAFNQPPSDSAAGASDSPSVSQDGRYVAFESTATNLVPGQGGAADVDNVFLLDHMGGMTLVSHAPDSFTQAPPSGFPSYSPLVNADGGFVLYGSEAPEFAPGLTPFNSVVVLYNINTRQNILVSHKSGSLTTPATGADGQSAHSDPEAISANGEYVLFASDGVDLVPNQQSSGLTGVMQLYLYDSTTGITQLVSHAAGPDNVNVTDDAGIDTGFIGETGKVVYARVGAASVADDGTVAYVDASNNVIDGFSGTAFDVYRYNPGSQTNQLISFVPGSSTVGAGGITFGAVISSDGKTVAYVSQAGDLVDGQSGPSGVDNVFVWQQSTGTNALASGSGGSATVGGNANSGAAGLSLTVSADGGFVAFTSSSNDLVTGQGPAAGNVFLYDTQSPSLTLLSGVDGSATVAAGGVPDLTPSGIPTGPAGPTGPADPITSAEFVGGPQVLSMSADGSLVAFVSDAPDLVLGQSGAAPADNVFLYSSATGHSTLVSGVDGSATATPGFESSFPVLSRDGSLLAFHSEAANLDDRNDENGVADVFTATPGSSGPAALVSQAAFPAPEAPGNSYSTSVSADGRFTVFTSNATNLVPNQVTVNSQQNVFVYDNQKGTITLVNHVPGAFNTTGDGGVHGGFFKAVDASVRPPDYVQPVLSADGSTIAFASFDDNLVPNETPQHDEQTQSSAPGPVIEFIYLYDVGSGQITLVNHAPGDTARIQAPEANGVFYDSFQPAINLDGSEVAFAFGQPADDGVGVALYSRASGATTILAPDVDTGAVMPRDPSISDNGQFVSYLDQGQVYVYDRVTGRTVLVSHDNSSPASTELADGVSSAPVISHDGSAIAFVSTADNLVSGQVASGFTNVFLYRNDTSGNDAVGPVSLVSCAGRLPTACGDGNSDSPAIDGDGTAVAYRSDADNLVADQSGATGNIFSFDTGTGAQTLVSHQAGDPTVGAGGASEPVIDDDEEGHLVSYVSTANDLIPNQSDPAAVENVFIWLRQTDANILASGQGGSPTVGGNADSDFPLLTRDSFPGFSSTATNLVSGVGGSSIAYINTLVQVSLSPSTVALGSPAGSVVGELAVSSLLAGQYLPPVYSLPGGAADNDLFGLSGAALRTAFAAASPATYQVLLVVDVGFGKDPVVLDVLAAGGGSGGSGGSGGGGGGTTGGITALLVAVKVGKKKKTTRLLVEVFDAATGAEKETIVSPFQKPAYTKIQVSVNGAHQVVVTARKGKKKVSRIVAG